MKVVWTARRVALALTVLLALVKPTFAQQVLIEAESFKDHGGWVLDTQFVDIMGSPYLLAHGLGKPVKDATTTVAFPSTGTYKVFVHTKDWVARWKAPGTPGKFRVLVNGKPLAQTFGTKGADWFWHDGGTVRIAKQEVKLALHDLTGFEGRCDAIWFTTKLSAKPPKDLKAMAAWRKKLLGLSEKPAEAGTFDLVVIGGGYGGLGAAVSGARMGCKVALIQDRPVLGGNGSAEVRVWPQGRTRTGLYPRLGEIIEELSDRPKESPGTTQEFDDAKREVAVRAEKNISLFLNHRGTAVEMDGKRIAAVTATDMRTGQERRFTAKLVVDCTGHGTIGVLAGADHTIKEQGHMGMSNMWRWEQADSPQPFPAITWALPLTMEDFPYPKKGVGPWFWETGFDKHPIRDLEYMRDWNFRAVYGAFNAMKNGGGKADQASAKPGWIAGIIRAVFGASDTVKSRDVKAEHANAKLEWLAYIGGPRESRQLLGDVVLTRDDVADKKEFPDGCVPTTWSIDLHYPKEEYAKKFPNDPFISRAEFDRSVDSKKGYPVPYRCFYSRNIENLFMAGRNVSVTHEALGTIRVMKTGGMMGEVVGKAASICLRHNCAPRDVYHSYLDELKELMNQRGWTRRDTVDGKFYDPPGGPDFLPSDMKYFNPAKLQGIVVDDDKAELVGTWQEGTGLANFIGTSYTYHSPKDKASARFKFTVPKTGRYEVRFAYQPHENRASNTPVTVRSADGEKLIRVNERVAPTIEPTFVSLGIFQFDAATPGIVEVTNDKANGNVAIDAIQVLPA
ncbi:MAG: FAD-dependent oxidoreductase, partial [Verrucomicrobia bacterium]|nr:FAD-dependent oxidoreductase [Verrucomicrobiota bacterium]